MFLRVLTSIATIPGSVRAEGPLPEASVVGYREFLRKLDTRDRKSIPAARAELENRFTASSEGTAAEAFRAFRKFYSGAVESADYTYFWPMANASYRWDYQAALNDAFSGDSSPLEGIPSGEDHLRILEDTAIHARLKMKYGAVMDDLIDYRTCGIGFSWSEGNWYAVEDPGYLAAAGAFLKGDYRDFLVFRAREGKDRVTEGAALTISWDALRQRILRHETFVKEHPGLPETESEVRRELHCLTVFYLAGIDNTPAYTLFSSPNGPGEIQRELRWSYERFLAGDGNSSLYPVIANVYGILTRNDFTYCGELEAYLVSEGYGDCLRMYG